MTRPTGYAMWGGSNPGKGKTFSSSSKCPDRSWGPPSGYQGSVSGLKETEREVDHSPSFVSKGSGSIPLCPVMLSWCGQGDLDLFTLLHVREILCTRIHRHTASG